MCSVLVNDVWASNLDYAFKKIVALIPYYPVITFDTEFPGVISGVKNFSYKLVKENVENTKLIQVGMTLSSRAGNFSEKESIWQFHLKFDLEKEKHALSSIDLLKESGLNFDHLKHQGISQEAFRNYLIYSGILRTPTITWVCYHGIFDFAYFLHIIINQSLPDNERTFKSMLSILFPKIYDVKTIAMGHFKLKGGLSQLAEIFSVKGLGRSHQAGNDSYVTAKIFHTLYWYLQYQSVELKGMNVIFGTEETLSLSKQKALEEGEKIKLRSIMENFTILVNRMIKMYTNPEIQRRITYNSQLYFSMFSTDNKNLTAFIRERSPIMNTGSCDYNKFSLENLVATNKSKKLWIQSIHHEKNMHLINECKKRRDTEKEHILN